MSLVISSYETISSKYEGHELALVKKDPKSFNWDRAPILISPQEKAAMDFPHVMEIMKGRVKSPSELAGLPQQGLSPIVRVIDELYNVAIKDYKNLLEQATQKDLNNLKLSKKGFTFKWLAAAFGGSVVFGGAGAGAGSPFGGLGAIPGGIIGLIVGFIFGSVSASRIIKNGRLRDGSTHRIQWMQVVDAFEKRRHEEIKAMLKGNGQALVREIKAMEKDGKYSIEKIKGLRQLYLINLSMFQESFIIEETNVGIYLGQLQNKVPHIDNLIK